MPQTPGFRYDVFLSHNKGDKPRVRRLAERLKKAGLRVWLDEWVIRPGDDIYLAIERGLEAARVQVLCLSPAALGSEWVDLERSTVLFRDPTNAGRRFIPLVLADCKLPDTLRRYKYVDFREEGEAAFEELLTACRVATEEVPEALPPKSAQTARPTLIERLLGSKRAEEPPASKPKPKEKKPQPVKPPEETEPLAVLERKLTGHKGWVNSVAVSPDGKWMASGSRDKTVKIWDLKTGTCRATLEGHTDEVQSVAITPDGKRILSASFDKSVRVWDASSGRELAKLDGHANEVWSVVALQDNGRALSGDSTKHSGCGISLHVRVSRPSSAGRTRPMSSAPPSIGRGPRRCRGIKTVEFGSGTSKRANA
ncbi:MAG: toll/interleukin-1 receptor domain-containing protein [bacterium]